MNSWLLLSINILIGALLATIAYYLVDYWTRKSLSECRFKKDCTHKSKWSNTCDIEAEAKKYCGMYQTKLREEKEKNPSWY